LATWQCSEATCGIAPPLLTVEASGSWKPIQTTSKGLLQVSQNAELILVLGDLLEVFDARSGALLFRTDKVNFTYWEDFWSRE
jgi:hypothetical protein